MPRLDAAARAERSFLASCIAVPAAGRELLLELDLDEDFTTDLTRRAAAHLRDHPGAPTTGLPPGDDELAALMAELAVRATGTRASTAALEADALQLELLHLERRIAGARTTRTGEIAPLVGRREELRVRYDAALARAMEETQAVDG